MSPNSKKKAGGPSRSCSSNRRSGTALLHSFGAVVWRKARAGGGWRREYLLLRNVKGHWDFPKGLHEAGERPGDTIRREAREEAGIHAMRVMRGFERELRWRVSFRGRRAIKIARFAVACTTQRHFRLSREHDQGCWVTRSEALRLLKFRNARGLLRAADLFLDARANTSGRRGA